MATIDFNGKSFKALPMHDFNEATLRLDAATSIISALSVFAGEECEISVSGETLAGALSGVGILLDDAKNLLAKGA